MTVNLVTLRGLVKRYPDFELGPLDLDIAPGTVLALIGPNGSGKTTTLNCIAGLVRPNGGTVEIAGRPAGPNQPGWKGMVGYVGEESGFYRRFTGARNLDVLASLNPALDRGLAERLAARLALPLAKRFKDLSRGNQTKLALIAALAHRPRLLLLDEPTAGLDPVVRSEVLDLLWETMEDGEHAVLYSTHVLSDIARLADELVFLRAGRILLRAPKDVLVEAWRRVSFRLDGEAVGLPGVVSLRSARREHQVVTRDAGATLERLRQLGADDIEASRLTVDEIAVEILREGHHVAAAQS